MKWITTPIPALTSASVVATCVCRTHVPSAVCTVRPSTLFSRSTTDVASRSANPYCSATAPGIASFWWARSAWRSRASNHPWIVASRSGGTSSGASRSIGSRGPVWEPGATAASDAASIRSIPAPLARAGTGPTHTSTGTGSSTKRCARATPSWPIVPAESTCSTITAPSATACSRCWSR